MTHRERARLVGQFWLPVLICIAFATYGFAADGSTTCTITGELKICSGTSTELCGPSDMASYAWEGPEGFVSDQSCIEVSAAGLYTLTVVDGDGAELTCDARVVEFDVPVCEISGETMVLAGETTELCGPEGVESYAWMGPEGFSADSRCITVGVGGVYTLTLTSDSGCESTCEVEVVVEMPLVCEISVEGDEPSICVGGSVELCGPEGAQSYAWMGPEGFSADGRCTDATAPGEYTLTLDGELSCKVEIVLRDQVPCEITSDDLSIGEGESTELCGPEGAAIYAWTGPEEFAADGRCVTVEVPGVYTLMVTSQDGCETSCEVEVTREDTPLECVITSGDDDLNLCPGESVELCGPEGADSYLWEGPQDFTADGRCITVDAAGEYVLTLNAGLDDESKCAVEVIGGKPVVCEITGDLTIVEGGSTELCGPEGAASYKWTGPSDFMSDARCVTVEMPGVYELVLTSEAGCLSSCEVEVELETGVECVITTPDDEDLLLCEHETVELCGPEGAETYTWSGPMDFESFDRCVVVEKPGVYTLILNEGMDTETDCKVEVLREDCGGGFNCPRSPGFWKQQCAQKENGSTKFTEEEVAMVAACVDERSDFFDWGEDAFAGFCEAIDPSKPMTQSKQLMRQYASFLANVCTGELELVASNGARIALDLDTSIDCKGIEAGTLGDLIGEVDGILGGEDHPGKDDDDCKDGDCDDDDDDDCEDGHHGEDCDDDDGDGYDGVIECLDDINNGRGIGEVCNEEDDDDDCPEYAKDGDCEEDEDGIDDSIGDPRGLDRLSETQLVVAPNPFGEATTIHFVVPSGKAAVPVEVAIYDVSGRRVRTLLTGSRGGGEHQVQWDGRSNLGRPVARGVYYARAVVGPTSAVTRVLYLK